MGTNRPVGWLAPNPFGLYDVCGNVREMAISPQGHVFGRGGEAGISAWQSRSASRLAIDKPEESNFRQGFRVAMVGDLTPGPLTDKRRLQGAWVAEAAEKDGQPLPKELAAQIRVHFDGGNIRLNNARRQGG